MIKSLGNAHAKVPQLQNNMKVKNKWKIGCVETEFLHKTQRTSGMGMDKKGYNKEIEILTGYNLNRS